MVASATRSRYLIKFGNTDFENAEHVGTIGKSYSSTDPQNLSISTLDDGDLFTSVALTDDGSGLVVGAQRDDGFDGTATNTGAVYLITFSNTDFDNPNHVGTIGSGYTSSKTSLFIFS